jgi:hypothetical protein
MVRRVLYTPERVHALLRKVRADEGIANFETLCELHDLKREVAELRDILGLMVSTLRTQAEADVAQLRRQLEHALTRLERRPTTSLH